MIGTDRWDELSISETDHLNGIFLCNHVWGLQRIVREEKKISSEQQICERKGLVDARGQRMGRLA